MAKPVKTVFVTGTAGSGKSLLSSKISEYYTAGGSFAAILNMDPGAESLPYACDVDVRDHVDVVQVMRRYELGPNGALVMASDLAASKIGEIREQVDAVSPDYLIVDTPGQVELFAYRSSGPFIAENLAREERVCLFLFDGALASSPTSFVSVSLLATSIRLRLGLPAVNVLTKRDLVAERLGDILGWTTSAALLSDALAADGDGETYALSAGMLRGLGEGGFAQGILPVSNVTGEGMEALRGALSRILNLGEEVED